MAPAVDDKAAAPPGREIPASDGAWPAEAQRVLSGVQELKRLHQGLEDALLFNLIARVDATCTEGADLADVRDRRRARMELEAETDDLYALRTTVPARIVAEERRLDAILARDGRARMAELEKRAAAVAHRAIELPIVKLGALSGELLAISAEANVLAGWVNRSDPLGSYRAPVGVPTWPATFTLTGLDVLGFVQRHPAVHHRLNGKGKRA